jgi:putative endonuclease
MHWYVYMLRCCDGSFYTGITNDVSSRVAVHNNDKVRASKYVWSRRPATLVYTEPVTSRSDALVREAALKKLTRTEKQCLIKQ